MNRTVTAFCGFMLGAAALAAPAEAMPIAPAAGSPSVTSQATPVWYRRGFYAVGGVYYYNGYRGYWRVRPGYRYYNGYWFPAAAFAAGVAAATVAPAPLPAARLAAAHVRWCSERYVSFRAWDNSYQPYEGPRQQCWSPYS
ncbi:MULTISPECIES: BA14K family protein [unclassified Mesorhizobium]|uniref:BA14K family protein n=1 Tax=unclassified Mesorhizobium TaxID=325217 RepID=UPI000FC9FB3E|nr:MULTISPECIES: BA14K family protein [unclassified Mesorhizobium]TGP20224.1 BA14K family protein [Mesorhizobium sp. M1D.F.Ca.ET.231.01.1.1]TGP27701.1 BA14K family protein [Mesorhizobium sp. M1D.F.Ca.ET.234.01.1.1]TGS42051.1 BA14K family protein [Mesorhizobium sp. M1D.F.Ca.ET.184.01.1.1]TGS59403.1 BA14K family protein [Mesorhizobium sp. M1D.F.Ca.ET.183.01.1.1]